MKNNSRVYYNGSIWETKNCGKIETIGKSIRENYYICKFEDNTIVESRNSHISDGSIKNYNYPSVANIGYIGYGKYIATIKT